MWIRSQDCVVLVKCDYFAVDLERLAAGQSGDDSLFIVGTFPTKEDALAELDNLEHWAGCGGIGVYQVSKP